MGSGNDRRSMLFLMGPFAALVIATSAAAASNDPGGGSSVDKRHEGYAMVWQEGKRVRSDGFPLYRGRYVLSPPREPIRQAIA